MTREPSIHVTRTELKRLIQKYILKGVTDQAIQLLMKEARDNSLTSRSVLIDTKKEEKKVASVVKGAIGDANLLAQIIASVRVKMKHFAVKKITQEDNQWSSIKELVETVNEFCNRYQLDKRNGYIEFVTTGLNLMSKGKKVNYNYCASWMAQKVDWILSQYESNQALKSDNNYEATLEAHDIYISEILERTGIREDYSKDANQMVHFLRVRELADEMGVEPYVVIMAQFQALEFCNGIPQIQNLYSDKAKQNTINYMSKNKIVKGRKKIKVDDNIWKQFKES